MRPLSLFYLIDCICNWRFKPIAVIPYFQILIAHIHWASLHCLQILVWENLNSKLHHLIFWKVQSDILDDQQIISQDLNLQMNATKNALWGKLRQKLKTKVCSSNTLHILFDSAMFVDQLSTFIDVRMQHEDFKNSRLQNDLNDR